MYFMESDNPNILCMITQDDQIEHSMVLIEDDFVDDFLAELDVLRIRLAFVVRNNLQISNENEINHSILEFFSFFFLIFCFISWKYCNVKSPHWQIHRAMQKIVHQEQKLSMLYSKHAITCSKSN